MLPNHVQISCGQRLFDQGAGQPDSMILVGACQGRQDPTSRPCGDMALAQGVQDLFGQVVDQGQAPADPAGIASQFPGHLSHAPFETARQVPDQKSLFHGLPLALLTLAQDHGQHVGFAFLPDIGAHDVHPEYFDGLQAQIAVDEHKALFLLGHQDRRYLPKPAHGGDHCVQRSGPGHARMRVTGDDLEAFDVFDGHGKTIALLVTSIFASRRWALLLAFPGCAEHALDSSGCACPNGQVLPVAPPWTLADWRSAFGWFRTTALCLP